MSNFTFVVDTREKEPVKERVLKKYENAKLEALHAGDFACKKRQRYLIGVERKTLEDFVGSISTKRIFSQIEKLHATYPVVILILEGKMETLRGTLKRLKLKFNEAAFWGTITSIIVRDNFQIFWSPDRNTTINMAYMVCMKMAEGKYDTIRRWRPKSLSKSKDLLVMIPGVTDKLATNLLKRYGSIVAIGTQTQKELCSNKGIGPSLAKRLRKYLAGK